MGNSFGLLESEDLMPADVSKYEEIITAYGNCPSQLATALFGLSESALNIHTSAEGWSIREIVHHLADGDDLWKMCVKQAIGQPESEFINWYWQMPQTDWAKSWNYSERAIEPSLAMFHANRKYIVHLLRSTPGAIEKTIRVRWPTIGERAVLVADIVQGQTHHVTEHIAEITHMREAHTR